MVRTHTKATATGSSSTSARPEKPKSYSTKLSELRGKLRNMIDAKIRERTKGRVKKMGWTMRSYRRIVVKGGLVLRGWRRGLDGVPFQNLSDIKGGKAAIQRLMDDWEAGELRFEEATEDEVDVAFRRSVAMLPGDAPVLPKPKCFGPFVRNDMGKTRDPKKKKQRPGPKTQKIVSYEPDDDAEEIESGAESEADTARSASIEQSSDVEREQMSDIEDFSD